jgi:hypothetical protein
MLPNSSSSKSSLDGGQKELGSVNNKLHRFVKTIWGNEEDVVLHEDTNTLLCCVKWIIQWLSITGGIRYSCKWTKTLTPTGHYRETVVVKRQRVKHFISTLFCLGILGYMMCLAHCAAKDIGTAYESYHLGAKSSWCAKVMAFVIALPVMSSFFGIVCVATSQSTFGELLSSMSEYDVIASQAKAMTKNVRTLLNYLTK